MLAAEHNGKARNFARVDWNGSGHENRSRFCPAEVFLTSAGRSHFHDPQLHRNLTIEELFGLNLPSAVALESNPSTFSELMERCARLLHIHNLTDVEEPPWLGMFL